MTTSVLGQFQLCAVDDDLGPFLFLKAHEQRGDAHLVKRDLKHAVTRDVLPTRAVLERTIDAGACADTLARVDDAVVLLRTWKSAADVWVTAPDEDVARAIAAEVMSRVRPRSGPRRVEVRFTSGDSSTRYLDLDVRPWLEVADAYPDSARRPLTDLMAHRHAAEDASRLLLWHGAPGTGKTTAIRALIHSWSDWADAIVVTDPDELLNSGKYLRRVMLDADDDERWQLMVLEDAESLLHKGSGKGMAKLLNLCDGLLGQGLRCMFLITTNEPLQALHPALVRPGRCLAHVEFGPLPAAQAARILGRPVDRDMTLAEVMTARPLSVVQQPVAIGQYL